jgi:hypothetical protein
MILPQEHRIADETLTLLPLLWLIVDEKPPLRCNGYGNGISLAEVLQVANASCFIAVRGNLFH